MLLYWNALVFQLLTIVFQNSNKRLHHSSNGQTRKQEKRLELLQWCYSLSIARKIRHFPIIKSSESNRKHAHSQFQRTCPAKDKEHSETREVKESDLIPPEHPELKVTVTWLHSIILTNFRKTKAAFDAFQCPDTSENQILKINQAGKAQFHVGQLYIWDGTLGRLRLNADFRCHELYNLGILWPVSSSMSNSGWSGLLWLSNQNSICLTTFFFFCSPTAHLLPLSLPPPNPSPNWPASFLFYRWVSQTKFTC